MMKKRILIVFVALLFIKVNAQQEGFRTELNVGPTVGDARAYFSYALQANFYYMWPISQTIDLGVAAGVMVFLGEGDNFDNSGGVFGSIPDVFLPAGIAIKAHFSDLIFMGLDAGYGISANALGSSDGDFIEDGNGGFYLRPILGFNLKEKLALIVSYASVSEKYGASSSISIGVNFGF